MRRSTATGWVLVGLFVAALGQGCGSSAKPRAPGGSAAAAGTGGKDGSTMVVEPPGTSGMAGESPYDPLCGVQTTEQCLPDDGPNSSCKARVVSSTGGKGPDTSAGAGAGGESGARAGEAGVPQGGAPGNGGEGGQSTLGGQGGESPSGAGQPASSSGAGAGGEAGVASAGAAAGRTSIAGRSSGSGGQSVMTMKQLQSCQVSENPRRRGQPLSVCADAGVGPEGSACFSGADCAPGLACVGSGPGECRPYCCTGNGQCKDHPGTHCAVAELVSSKPGTPGLGVPVCLPAIKCSLSEPYPCGDAHNCSCGQDGACVVVYKDGTTSCVPSSELPPKDQGTSGLPCPCAWGFVCSANQCIELCQVALPDTCDSHRCQSSASLPDGWGTCIGSAPKDAGAP